MKLRTIKWIQSRAARDLPLNLHAVMRERPTLLEEAFAGTTPRGWRRTLIDAGVDPYAIRHEHQEDVRCEICGQWSTVLGTHLVIRHGTTREEYLEEYGPSCELSSEAFRAAHFGSRPVAGIPHWEGLWSRLYVVDWIIRLNEEGLSLNYQSVLEAGKPLASAGRNTFGSWDAALKAAGFDPDDHRLFPPSQQWTGEMVIERLRDFSVAKRENWLLAMPSDLRQAATRLFGSPEQAPKAAGLRFVEINQRAIFTGPDVPRLVEDLRKLEGLKGGTRRKKLSEIYHKSEENRRIIQYHFGSLKRLAEQKGIDPRAVSLCTYRDETDVHHDLDLLENQGLPLCFTTLRKGYKRLYNVMSETGWGTERLGKTATRSGSRL